MFGALFIAMLFFKKTRRLGRLLLGGLVAVYLILSLPVVSTAIAGHAPASDIAGVATLGPFDDIFLLDGDNYEARAALAATLDRTIKVRWIWILGYGELRDALRASGVSPDRWRWGYSDGDTTQGQVSQIRRLMDHYKSHRAVAIVSRLQAERLEGLVRKQGLNVVVLAAPVDAEPPTHGASRFLPSMAALFHSRDAIYERVALAYYRWKGWV